MVCPTRGRQEKHADPLYARFAADAYEPKELLVYDDSPKASPFFVRLRDPRVRYWHGKPLSVGAARNFLIAQARGLLIENRDDDDDYYGSYSAETVARLLSGAYDLVKLGIFVIRRESDRSLWRWDTDECGGLQYAIAGDGRTLGPNLTPADELYCRTSRVGWGFGHVYTKALADKIQYADSSDGEDHEWLTRCLKDGARVGVVRDGESWVTHVVHEKTKCLLFPQEFLGYGDRPPLRHVATETKPIEVPPITPRSDDERFEAGHSYTLVALLKNSNKLSEIDARVKTYGFELLKIEDNVASPSGEQAPEDYRFVRADVRATRSGSIPREVPAPLSWFNKSRIVSVRDVTQYGLGAPRVLARARFARLRVIL
jgi:hypothetical protein